MTNRTYSHKDSGIDWIGAIPSHWLPCRIKHALKEMGSGGTPDTSNSANWGVDGDGTPWVAIGDMSQVDVVASTMKTISDVAIVDKQLRIWPEGTLLFSMYASLGHTAKLQVPAATNQAILALVPAEHCDQQFLTWWFRFLRAHLIEGASTNTQDNLNAQKVANLPFFRFGLLEQQTIAAFLDRETAKIDALVAEQERLLAVLAEKRQAVISRAVAQGVDPSVPMKDSGMEWLGKVPVHWTTERLRHIARLETGHTPSRQHPEYWLPEECVIPWFTLSDVGTLRDGRKLTVCNTTERISTVGMANSAARLLPASTVFLSRTASVGFSGIMDVPMAVSQDFAAWICGPRLSSRFLLYCLRAMQPEFRRLMFGATHKTIYMPDIERLRIPLPPRDEQDEIVQHLDVALHRIDVLLDMAEHAVKLLKERRSALISAAVTGKMDVRGLMPIAEPAREAA